MAGPVANIRSFVAPPKGPARSAATLLEDLILFDARYADQAGRNLLEDGPPAFSDAGYIGHALPADSCLHEFCLKKRQSAPPALDERPNSTSVWQAAAICKKCRVHLLLEVDYTAAWQDEPCPTWHNPLHHLVNSSWRRDVALRELRKDVTYNSDQLYVYECSARKCSAVVTVRLSPPNFSEEALHILLDKEQLRQRTVAAFESKKGQTEGMKSPTPLDVLVDLRAYFRNTWVRDGPTAISLDNKRFVVRFGPGGEPCRAVLESIGFELKPGESWIVPRPEPDDSVPIQKRHNIFLDDVEAELEVLIANIPKDDAPGAQDMNLEPALREMSRVLGSQNYEKDPRSRSVQYHPLNRERSFTVLGIPQDASDDLVIWAYRRQSTMDDDNPKRKMTLMTALEDIQRKRNSEKLTAHVAIERSLGHYGEQSVSDAYRAFGLSQAADLPDSVILGNFSARVTDAPNQEQELREALTIIGEHRNSQVLKDVARNTVNSYEDALSFLDAETGTEDPFVATLYTTKVNDSPSNRDLAQKALQMIAEYRNSEGLKAFIAAGFQGDISQANMDIGEAYSALGIDDRTLDDETIATIFEIRVGEDPTNKARLETAMQRIVDERNNSHTTMPNGQFAPQPPQALDEPIGLNNIGNTCYLNSLLQVLFTITSVRQIVLDFDKYRDSLQNIKGKKVGTRIVDEKEIRSSQRFVQALADLFQQMITSPTSSVQPTAELARLTMESSFNANQRRRSTIGSQRRPTLIGTSDSRSFIGPLPQPIIENVQSKPLQSPEPMQISEPPLEHIDEVSSEPGQASAQSQGPNAEVFTQSHTEQHTQAITNGEQKLADTTQHNSHLAEDEHQVIYVEDNPLTSAKNQVLTQGGVATEKEMSVQLVIGSENTGTAGHVDNTPATIYKPPEGPPPVPPRPNKKPDIEYYARQQDVTEVTGYTVIQLSCAIRSLGTTPRGDQRDEIYETFYGEDQPHKAGSFEVQGEALPFSFLPCGVYNKPKDIYGALDNWFDPDKQTGHRTIKHLPPVLCMFLARGAYRHEDSRLVEYKIDDHVEVLNTIYMDRYMDAEPGSVLLERRKQSWKYKEELRILRERMEKLEPPGAPPIDEDLNTGLLALQHLTEVSVTDKMDDLAIGPEITDSLSELIQAVRQERIDLKKRTEVLEQLNKNSFTDFRKQEYKIHAAFFHRGTPGSGHFWVYIYDHIHEIWRKYNDQYVTPVHNLNEIFGNPWEDRNNPNYPSYGRPANPYFLVYVRSDQLQARDGAEPIVETVRREPVQPTASAPPADDLLANGTSINRDDTFMNEAIDIRPLGSQTPDPEAQVSHHEFAGQQSQMSYLPPEGRPPGKHNIEEMDEMSYAMGPSAPSRQVNETQDSWDQVQIAQAIEQSMQPEPKGGDPGWKASEAPTPRSGW